MNIEKYTITASKRIWEAQSLANKIWNPQISNIHLLSSIINWDDSIIIEILKNLWVNIENLKIEINNLIKKEPTISWDNSLSISQSLQNTLLEAEKISSDFKDEFITEEHLFLGLIKKSNWSIFDLLQKNWIEYNIIKDEILKIRNWEKITDNDWENKLNLLKKYWIDMIDLAKSWKIDPVIWREEEIRRTLEILSRRTKNNPVLIWDPWVWKTAIIEWIARKIADKEAPEILLDKKIISLDMWSLLAWAKYRWEFEERLKWIIKEIEKSNWKIILFIDELHTIVWAWNAEWQADAWNLLKPSLARWTLHMIWATTINEYRKYIEKDPALERRFANVIIDEPTREDSISILRWIKEKYENHHWIKITDEAIVWAVDMSIKYISWRKLPDKAIDLIDEALAWVKLSSVSKPINLDILQKNIRTLQIELEAKKSEKIDEEKLNILKKEIASKTEEYNLEETKWKNEKKLIEDLKNNSIEIEELKFKSKEAEKNSNFEEVAKINYSLIPNLEQKNQEIQNKLNELKKNWLSYLKDKVDIEDIAKVISKWTSIPVTKLIETDREKLLHLEDILKKSVVWQDSAIISISNAIRRSKAWLWDENKPIWSFLFLWPTWVWKTQTAKALSEYLFNSKDNFIRIDCSEYSEKFSIQRLIWAPPGYIWYDEWWQLTEAVRKKPYSVILFDEVEKAHSEIFNVLLQVLDDWRLTDWKWKTVDFRNTIIILTSNIWSLKIQNNIQNLDKKEFKDEILNDLKWFFKPEFINRIDDIIIYNSLNKEMLFDILDINLENISKLLSKKDIKVEFLKNLKQYLIEIWYDKEYWARPLKRAINDVILNELSKEIISWSIKSWDNIKIDYDLWIKIKKD